jgi:hypothetical protein
LRGLRRPLRTATLIIAAEFGRYAASLGAPVVRDRGLDGVKQHGRSNDIHLGRLDGDECRWLDGHESGSCG